MVSFKVTKEEAELIVKIAARAQVELFNPKNGQEKSWCKQTEQDTQMDLCATIAQGVPLRLEELLSADNFNFCHDIAGIYRHIDRSTGKLEGFFRPRFVK